jgi:hypothetical protein
MKTVELEYQYNKIIQVEVPDDWTETDPLPAEERSKITDMSDAIFDDWCLVENYGEPGS